MSKTLDEFIDRRAEEIRQEMKAVFKTWRRSIGQVFRHINGGKK